jgi:glycosyltransferase involved in cell wall biosynthesis
MRIVDLCPYGVYPPRSGGHRIVHHTSACLGARHDVFVFAMGLRRGDGLRFRSFTQRPDDRYTEYRHVTPLTYLSYLRRRRTGLPPLNASLELQWTAPRALERAIAAADIVQVQQPWQFAYCRHTAACPVVVVVQNAEVELLRARDMSDRLVARAARLERAALEQADAVIFLSGEDRDRLTTSYGLQPGGRQMWQTCGVGVDTELFRPASDADRAAAKAVLGLGGPVAIFAGSWHVPNRSALAALRAIAARAPEWTFLVVGSVGRREESSTRIRVSGPVDDTLPYFRAADVALNPMTEGSGVNLKVLEYLAMGLPTVSTRLGVRGLDVADSVQVAELEDFPALLVALHSAEERARRGRGARTAAETRFTWESIANARERMYEQLRVRLQSSRG